MVTSRPPAVDADSIELTEVFRRLRRHAALIIVLAAAGLAGGVVAAYWLHGRTAVVTNAVLSLPALVEKQGLLYPDGSPFRPADLLDARILETATARSGAAADLAGRVTVSRLAGLAPADGGAGALPAFRLSLTTPPGQVEAAATARDLLAEIVRAYEPAYASACSRLPAPIEQAFARLETVDFPAYERALASEINAVQTFLTNRKAYDPAAQDACETFLKLELPYFSTEIKSAALAKNPARAASLARKQLALLERRERDLRLQAEVLAEILGWPATEPADPAPAARADVPPAPLSVSDTLARLAAVKIELRQNLAERAHWNEKIALWQEPGSPRDQSKLADLEAAYRSVLVTASESLARAVREDPTIRLRLVQAPTTASPAISVPFCGALGLALGTMAGALIALVRGAARP